MMNRGSATASIKHSTARGSRVQRTGANAQAIAARPPRHSPWAGAFPAAAATEVRCVANAERARETGASWQAGRCLDDPTDRCRVVSKSAPRLSNQKGDMFSSKVV